MAEQRDMDRAAELARQQAVIDAVAARNAELAAGADPDRSLEVAAVDKMAKARAAKAAKAAK